MIEDDINPLLLMHYEEALAPLAASNPSGFLNFEKFIFCILLAPME